MLPLVERIEFRIDDAAFRSVLETIPDAVVVIDGGGTIAAVNRTVEKLFGLTEDEVEGQPIEILMPERFRDAHVDQIRGYFANPAVVYGSQRFRHGQELELLGVRRNGEEFPVEISAGPLDTPDGRFALAVIRDISEKKRLQRELCDHNRKLEELVRERTRELERRQAELIQSSKMASLGALAAGVVHEMNTPLGAVHSANQSALAVARKLLAERGDLPLSSGRSSEQLQLLLDDLAGTEEKAVSQLTRIVGSLRAFARLDAAAEMEEADISIGLRSAIALLELQTHGRIEIEDRIESVTPFAALHADLNQVWMSLLSNAIEAIEGAGRISVSTAERDGAVRIEISDTGRGIAESDLAKVFDPGFTTKGVRVGAGLGLATAHRIIEEHGGRIEIDSRVGRGTRVRVDLPRGRAS